MKCLKCFALVSGRYCQCGEKMKMPELENSTMELKSYHVIEGGEPGYMRHIDDENKSGHREWIKRVVSETIHLPKQEKSKFWMENIKRALSGGVLC